MVELQRGIPHLIQQYNALLKKNLILSWRHKRSTVIQLFSSFFFIFLIFCIDKSINSRFSSTTASKNIFDPKTLIFPPIPPCEDKFFVRRPCFDFVWSGNTSTRIQSIVKGIMDNNPGRRIPTNKVRSFETREEVDAWLFGDPMRVPGALHFLERNATVISYGIQTNSTAVGKRGNFENPTFKFQIPLQIAAEREIARSLIQVPNFSWLVGLREFSHPAVRTFSAVGLAGPTFFLAYAMFGFVFQIGSLVAEKELKLRQAMSTMGLYETAYWFSWLTWEALMTLLSSLLLVLFGMLFQFNFFLHNSFPVLFLVFFLFQLNMIGFAFMISTFIRKSSSATTVGFSIFIVGFLTQTVTTFGFPYDTSFKRSYRIIWSFFPPNLFTVALKMLGDATSTPEGKGISWSQRADCPSTDDECVITIDGTFKWHVATFFLWFILALYFDNIIPNASGVRKSCFYFLNPGYWTGRGGNKVSEGSICSCTGSTPPIEDVVPDDEDVREEESIVKQQITETANDPNIAVQIRGLAKTYPGTRNIGCCTCKRTSPYHAVKVAENSLEEVKLADVANVRSGSYSGGMKRRLSVAIALIGDPKLVILDEPTTGMDPIIRRHVWDIIENAKKGRAIVLTTHSMEEADILGDRIAIMAKGKLRCIGTSIRLKSRFGTGFIASVSFLENTPGQTPPLNGHAVATNEPHHEAVKQFFKYHLDVAPKEETKTFLTFVIPHEKERLLTRFFAELQDREREFGIADIQLGLTTLEEVFLSIAKKAELESAVAEGTLVTLTLTTSGTNLQIPKGARFVGIPGTESAENPSGLMVEVYWEQDENGAFCISGHSSETPVPRNVRPMATAAVTSQRTFLGRRGPVHGFVFDPIDIEGTNHR